MRYQRALVLVIVLGLAGLAVLAYSLSGQGVAPSQSLSPSTPSHVYSTGTVTCYEDGCIPLPCPSWGCGPIVTTTVPGVLYFTRGTVTLNGTIKILPGTAAGIYFFDAYSVQYHLVFCNCTGTAPCNCPNIPAFTDGQKIRVTGTLVTPSTYGPVWAPGGDIYVQSWVAD